MTLATHRRGSASPSSSSTQVLMPLAEPPSAWQRHLGERISEALQRGLQFPASAWPEGTDGTRMPAEVTGWRNPLSWRPQVDHWASRLAPSRAQQALYARCLRHYAHYFGAAAPTHDDDAGLAVAGVLVACVQALEWHAATPQRWQALARWLDAEVVLPPFTPGMPLPWQPVCARMSLLTVAIGEWSQQASVQGTLAQGSAELMARQHLHNELGLDAELLLRALRHLQIIPAHSLRSAAHAPSAALPN